MTTPNDPAQVLLFAASRLHRLQIEVLADLKQPLTVRQFRILQRVDEGVSSLSDLSKLAHRSLPTTSESVEGLIRRGLITRTVSETDRRAVVLQVTRAGRRALDDGQAHFDRLAANLLAAVPASDRKAFARFATLVYEYAGREMWGYDT